MPRTASHSDSRLRVSARTATSLVTLTLLLSACGSTPADDTEAEAASPTSPATSPASADTSSLTASPTSPGLTASPTTAGPTGDRESATPTSRAQAEATSDSDTGSGGLPLGMTPIMLLHPGDSLPDWDLTVAMEEAGVYELRSNANSCLMRVGLERMPGAEAQYDTDAEATQSIVQQRLEGRESAVTVTGTQQVNLGMFGADHFEAHRYDASLLSEETLEPGHAVGLTRMFLEPEPSLWQTFYTCDVDDFDEDAFQDFLTSFGVVGDVEPSLED